MGLYSSALIKILSEKIREASDELFISEDTTIYVTTGSGGVAMSLYKVFPQATFGIFMTGGERYKNNVINWAKDKNNVILIPIIPEFPQVKPPYPTVTNYDDYIYSYIHQYGLDGDYIWNIAAENI